MMNSNTLTISLYESQLLNLNLVGQKVTPYGFLKTESYIMGLM